MPVTIWAATRDGPPWHCWRGLTLKAVEPFTDDFFPVVRALNQLASAVFTNHRQFKEFDLCYKAFRMRCKLGGRADPMKGNREFQPSQAKSITIKQLQEWRNLGGGARNSIEENNGL